MTNCFNPPGHLRCPPPLPLASTFAKERGTERELNNSGNSVILIPIYRDCFRQKKYKNEQGTHKGRPYDKYPVYPCILDILLLTEKLFPAGAFRAAMPGQLFLALGQLHMKLAGRRALPVRLSPAPVVREAFPSLPVL